MLTLLYLTKQRDMNTCHSKCELMVLQEHVLMCSLVSLLGSCLDTLSCTSMTGPTQK